MPTDPIRLKVERGEAANAEQVITPADGDYVVMLDADGPDGLEYPRVSRFDAFNGAALATEGGAGIAGIAETLETMARREGDSYYTRVLIA